jgi:hypothetical protein
MQGNFSFNIVRRPFIGLLAMPSKAFSEFVATSTENDEMNDPEIV